MDKKELAIQFIKEVDELDKNPAVSSFSYVPSQGEALTLTKNIPKDFDNDLITKLYWYLIRKEGIFTNLRFVKEAHYPLLLDAFAKIAPFVGEEKGGLLTNIAMVFLFNNAKDNQGPVQNTQFGDFMTFLSVIMQAKKYTNVPGIVSHQESFEEYAKNNLITDRAIETIEKIHFDEGDVWAETRIFWTLLSIILWDKSDRSVSLTHRFIDKNRELKRKRTGIYCFSKILNARKNEPHVKTIIAEIQSQYPAEWVKEYVYEA